MSLLFQTSQPQHLSPLCHWVPPVNGHVFLTEAPGWDMAAHFPEKPQQYIKELKLKPEGLGLGPAFASVLAMWTWVSYLPFVNHNFLEKK